MSILLLMVLLDMEMRSNRDPVSLQRARSCSAARGFERSRPPSSGRGGCTRTLRAAVCPSRVEDVALGPAASRIAPEVVLRTISRCDHRQGEGVLFGLLFRRPNEKYARFIEGFPNAKKCSSFISTTKGECRNRGPHGALSFGRRRVRPILDRCHSPADEDFSYMPADRLIHWSGDRGPHDSRAMTIGGKSHPSQIPACPALTKELLRSLCITTRVAQRRHVLGVVLKMVAYKLLPRPPIRRGFLPEGNISGGLVV